MYPCTQEATKKEKAKPTGKVKAKPNNMEAEVRMMAFMSKGSIWELHACPRMMRNCFNHYSFFHTFIP